MTASAPWAGAWVAATLCNCHRLGPRSDAVVINYGSLATDRRPWPKSHASVLGNLRRPGIAAIPPVAVHVFEAAYARTRQTLSTAKISSPAGHAFENPPTRPLSARMMQPYALARIDPAFSREKLGH